MPIDIHRAHGSPCIDSRLADFDHTDAVMWIIDSNDNERLDEAREELHKVSQSTHTHLMESWSCPIVMGW